MSIQSAAASFFLFIISLTWRLLIGVKSILRFSHMFRPLFSAATIGSSQAGHGQTVLVTTGRQAKTLHTVRALKQVGATVVVSDYNPISASALSLSCDKFILLNPLHFETIDQWIDHFRSVLVHNNIDVVLPVSTINEVLFIGLAKQRLQAQLPHIKWFSPDLDMALLLDDRVQFSKFCDAQGVPVPEHGILTTTNGIENIASRFSRGIILKRIDSTVNRSEEIVRLRSNEPVPHFVCPSIDDPWQWQRYVEGKEYSAWYVCDEGVVTFCACYHSEPDLLHFDPADLCEPLDQSLRLLIRALNLTGQYAFDFIVDEKTQTPFVIECNPRSSSVLETVSKTPSWGEAFFGVDVTHKTVQGSVGFIFHKTCWPWTSRSEGYFQFRDPLPFFAAEVIWPMNAIAEVALSEKKHQHIDVNIGKIIVPGPSTGRDMKLFQEQAALEEAKVPHISQC